MVKSTLSNRDLAAQLERRDERNALTGPDKQRRIRMRARQRSRVKNRPEGKEVAAQRQVMRAKRIERAPGLLQRIVNTTSALLNDAVLRNKAKAQPDDATTRRLHDGQQHT